MTNETNTATSKTATEPTLEEVLAENEILKKAMASPKSYARLWESRAKANQKLIQEIADEAQEFASWIRSLS